MAGKLLIVDDNEQNRYLLQVLLQGNGYEVVTVINGAEALETARQDPPDLIIADILMPVMDGFTLCRHWKADEQLKEIPFVFYTATYTSPQDEAFALELGAERFIIKPMEPDEFVGILQEVIAEHEAGDLVSGHELPSEEPAYYKLYNQVLIHKLEDKMTQLEETNRALQEDIARRKRAESEALESKQRLSQALTAARAGAWEWDIATNRAIWSEENYLILGLDPEMGEPTHETWLQCIHPEDRVSVEAEITQAVETGSDLNIEFRIVRPDGAVHWINSVGRLIFDDRGEPTAMYGIQIDITGRKRLEEQLWQAQKMQTIGQLAGGVAHDFNNILTIIGGSCEVILKKLSSDDPLRRDIEPIWQAQERAASLTLQLLAFSRKQVLQPRVLNLNTVLADLNKMIHRLIGEDIELIIRPGQDLGLVRADPVHIEQVIVNLAINGRDAMPYGGKLTLETANVILDEVYARQHVEVTSGPYVMLAVTDTGSGMDAATQAHIFEPFFTTKEPGKGTGLGLSTVHGIVNQSGGHIWVYSELGQGTVFKVYLPLIEAAVEPGPRQPVQGEIGRGTETVLVVEDEALVRDLVKNILQLSGYSVLEAEQGTEAIEVAREYTEPIHLLLTDIVLPGEMSGPEIAQYLTSRYPDLKVLYMSGYTNNAIVHHGVLDSEVTFLQKPFRSADLLYKVRAVLDFG